LLGNFLFFLVGYCKSPVPAAEAVNAQDQLLFLPSPMASPLTSSAGSLSPATSTDQQLGELFVDWDALQKDLA
jgi:hypothetical protein